MAENYSTTTNKLFVIWNKIKTLFNYIQRLENKIEVMDRELKNIRLMIPESDSTNSIDKIEVESIEDYDNVQETSAVNIYWDDNKNKLIVVKSPTYGIYWE
jgi:regulator of replication initiation timing